MGRINRYKASPPLHHCKVADCNITDRATPDFANEDFDFLDADESLKKFKKDLKSLNKRREYLINALYDDLQFKCAQTGRRFASKQSLDQHMDWLREEKKEEIWSRLSRMARLGERMD